MLFRVVKARGGPDADSADDLEDGPPAAAAPAAPPAAPAPPPAAGRGSRRKKGGDPVAGGSWWAARANTGDVTAGFTREEILRPAKEDPRAEGGLFGRVGGSCAS